MDKSMQSWRNVSWTFGISYAFPPFHATSLPLVKKWTTLATPYPTACPLEFTLSSSGFNSQLFFDSSIAPHKFFFNLSVWIPLSHMECQTMCSTCPTFKRGALPLCAYLGLRLRMRKRVPRALHRTACIHDDWEKERECAQKGKLALRSHLAWRTVSYEGIFLLMVVWLLKESTWCHMQYVIQE